MWGGRGKFISTFFPKMLILGLDNRKDAAKITARRLPKRHLTASDFEARLQGVHALGPPRLPGYKLREGKRRQGAQAQQELAYGAGPPPRVCPQAEV